MMRCVNWVCVSIIEPNYANAVDIWHRKLSTQNLWANCISMCCNFKVPSKTENIYQFFM